jgi:hypothetical protein
MYTLQTYIWGYVEILGFYKHIGACCEWDFLAAGLAGAEMLQPRGVPVRHSS